MKREDSTRFISPEFWTLSDILAQDFGATNIWQRAVIVKRVPGFSLDASAPHEPGLVVSPTKL